LYIRLLFTVVLKKKKLYLIYITKKQSFIEIIIIYLITFHCQVLRYLQAFGYSLPLSTILPFDKISKIYHNLIAEGVDLLITPLRQLSQKTIIN